MVQAKSNLLRIVVTALIFAGLLALGHWGSDWLIDLIGIDFSAKTQSQNLSVIFAGVLFYAALLAIPFVPGMEISLALFALFGAKVALPLYGATVAALTFSYLVGRILPIALIARTFRIFGLRRAGDLVLRLQPMSAGKRLDLLMARAPKRIVPTLLKHRYVAVVVALNLPGNAIIGGGGGIALLAGLSGLMSFPRYVLSVLLAVLPVPLFVWVSSNG